MSAHTIGDAPIEARYHQQMNELAHFLDDYFNGEGDKKNRTTGFVLLCFPFGSDDGRCNYISNSNRVDIKTMFKEQIARWEGMPSAQGNA